MPEYKHTYFDIRGLGELDRLLFALAKVPFEDIRIPFKAGETNAIPPELKQKLPYGQVPYLEYGDLGLSQSGTIARFLSRKFGFLGSNDVEAAKIEEIVDAGKDYGASFWPYRMAKDEEAKETAKKNIVDVMTPKYLTKFNQLLEKNGTGFLVGGKISLADVFVYYLFEPPIEGLGDLTKDYPAVGDLVKKVGNMPEIKEWVNKRPKTIY